MARIFISYRREDSAGHVGRLHDRLITRFGRDQVFKDIDSIEPGADFTRAIKEAMASCDVVLVVIGKQWLTGTDARGSSSVGTAFLKPTRRLDNPKDFVRQEIAAALTSKTRVIPVLVQGATMPNEEDLPEDLRGLAHHNAIEISDVRWDYDVERLVESLQIRSKLQNILNQRRKSLVVVLLLMLLSALGYFTYTLITYDPTSYKFSTDLKSEALLLIQQAKDPPDQHKAEIQQLRVKLRQAYEYEKGKSGPKSIKAERWNVLYSPHGFLAGGFLEKWEKEDRGQSPAFLDGITENVETGFDQLIDVTAPKGICRYIEC